MFFESNQASIQAHVGRNPNWVVYLLLLLILPGVWEVVVAGLDAAQVPFATARIEAFVLDGVMRLQSGRPLYPPVDIDTSIFHVYNPLAYLVPAGLSTLWSPSFENFLFAGRSISIAASVLLCLLIGYWMVRQRADSSISLLVALLPLVFSELVVTHFFRLRPESMALLFSGLAVLLLSRPSVSTTQLLGAVIFCLVSFACKQSYIVVPVIAVLHFALMRSFRLMARFVAGYAVGIVVFYTLMLNWFGEGVIDHTLLAMAGNEVYPLASIKLYVPYFFQQAGGLIAASMVAFVLLARQWQSNQMLLLLWVGALVWNLFTAGKAGSSSNYFAEFGLACVLLIGQALARSGCASQSASRLVILLPLLLHAALMASQHYVSIKPQVSRDDPGVDFTPYIQRYKQDEHLLIMNEKIAIQAGRPEGFDWFLLDLRRSKGLYDARLLTSRIRRQEFEKIVFSVKPTSMIERLLYQETVQSGYQRVYQDGLIMEWRSAH